MDKEKQIEKSFNNKTKLNQKTCISPSSRPKLESILQTLSKKRTSYAAAVTNSNTKTQHQLVTSKIGQKTFTGIADSAASRHFGPLTQKPNNHEPIQVTAANKGIMQSVAKRKWNLAQELSNKGSVAHEFKEMVNPLVSIPQLVDDGCEVTLTKTAIKVSKQNKPIIRGPRDPITRMWTIPFTVSESEPEQALHTIELQPKLACNAYTQKSTADLVTYHHITLGSVAPPTLIKAIKNGYLTTFPGLTVQAVRKYLPKSIPYYMSYIHKIRKNTRSTKKPSVEEMMTIDDGTFDPIPQPQKIKNRIHQVGVQTIDHDEFTQLTGMISTDQTGRFLVTSRQGNKYIMVLYDFDTNAILATAIKNQKAEQLVKGYNVLYDILRQAGIQTEIQRLDNETSKDLIKA